MVTGGDRERFAAIAGRLDWLAAVPDEALAGVVTRDGLCFWAFRRGDVPAMTGQDAADRELAAWLCAGCPVVDQCLELELRQAGADTVGVWGALPEDDRRAVYRAWLARRAATGHRDPQGGPAS